MSHSDLMRPCCRVSPNLATWCHSITDGLILEGTSGGHLVQPLLEQGHLELVESFCFHHNDIHPLDYSLFPSPPSCKYYVHHQLALHSSWGQTSMGITLGNPLPSPGRAFPQCCPAPRGAEEPSVPQLPLESTRRGRKRGRPCKAAIIAHLLLF